MRVSRENATCPLVRTWATYALTHMEPLLQIDLLLALMQIDSERKS